MQVNVGQYKNIIFDLGGVIINLSEANTRNAFAKLSNSDNSKTEESILGFEGYYQFEKGLITEPQFREALRVTFLLEGSDQTLDGCMNAMLLDIPSDRLNLLKLLKSKYRLFLLSNTNSIHMKCFNSILNEVTGEGAIDVYFEKAYYSHLVNMRKPDKEIFQLVLDENNLKATETLFLDDNIVNLEGADSVGIHTFHINNPSQLFELFK